MRVSRRADEGSRGGKCGDRECLRAVLAYKRSRAEGITRSEPRTKAVFAWDAGGLASVEGRRGRLCASVRPCRALPLGQILCTTRRCPRIVFEPAIRALLRARVAKPPRNCSRSAVSRGFPQSRIRYFSARCSRKRSYAPLISASGTGFAMSYQAEASNRPLRICAITCACVSSSS